MDSGSAASWTGLHWEADGMAVSLLLCPGVACRVSKLPPACRCMQSRPSLELCSWPGILCPAAADSPGQSHASLWTRPAAPASVLGLQGVPRTEPNPGCMQQMCTEGCGLARAPGLTRSEAALCFHIWALQGLWEGSPSTQRPVASCPQPQPVAPGHGTAGGHGQAAGSGLSQSFHRSIFPSPSSFHGVQSPAVHGSPVLWCQAPGSSLWFLVPGGTLLPWGDAVLLGPDAPAAVTQHGTGSLAASRSSRERGWARPPQAPAWPGEWIWEFTPAPLDSHPPSAPFPEQREPGFGVARGPERLSLTAWGPGMEPPPLLEPCKEAA